ncbi:MAG: PQQ-binding-like beta-propeller repeat protein [Chloroflexota bacterium]
MKRLALLSLIGLAALALSACGTPTNVSWPGLAADAENAYLANGNLVYAVRLSDGLKLWQYPEKSGGQVYHSNPVLTPDGQLLLGSAGTDNGIVSLDPATGRENWAAPLVANNHWIASPLVVGETIYAANSNGMLYAAELATGYILWFLPIDNSLWSAPTSDGKLVFVTSLDHTLYAVDPQVRAIAWKTALGGSAPGSATVSSDGSTVYVGSFDKKVFAIDAASGAIQWTAEVKDWVWGAPVQDGDTLYAADISGHIYSLGTTHGKNAWPDLQPDESITGSPLVLPDGVLVATESGTIFAYDRTGTKLWDVALGGQIFTTPVAGGDAILIAPMKAEFLLRAVSQDGKLLPWEFTGK